MDVQPFTGSSGTARARQARIEAQLKVAEEHLPYEVVLLAAPSLAALKRTHGAYFESFSTLARRLEQAVPAPR